MARFEVGKPLTTEVPRTEVDPGLLKAGRHRFRLVVVDADGLASQPDEVVVQVSDAVIIRPPVRPGRVRR